MPIILSKAPRAPRVPAPNQNEERPGNCYCSAFPRGSGPCLPCYGRYWSAWSNQLYPISTDIENPSSRRTRLQVLLEQIPAGVQARLRL
jgi:hypothetical protein